MQRQFSRQKEAYIKKVFMRGSSRIAWFCFFYCLFIEIKHNNFKITSIPLNHLMAFTNAWYNHWFKSFVFLQDLKLLIFVNTRTIKRGKNKKGKLATPTINNKKPIIIKITNDVLFKKIFVCLRDDLKIIDKKDKPKVLLQQTLRPMMALDLTERINMEMDFIKTYKKLYLKEKDMTKEQFEKYGIVELS